MHGSKNVKFKTFWYCSASRSEVSELDPISTEGGSPRSVASQARAGTVLALSFAVVLPPFSFAMYSTVLTTASFIINCPFITTRTPIFVNIFNREPKDAVTHSITFLAAATTFGLFCRNGIRFTNYFVASGVKRYK